ncbi:hypothetical protein FB45DRAFT_938902, partial [Roridomyces roridus]
MSWLIVLHSRRTFSELVPPVLGMCGTLAHGLEADHKDSVSTGPAFPDTCTVFPPIAPARLCRELSLSSRNGVWNPGNFIWWRSN